MLESKQINRCAIYTRKSSEEGLEQSFNSLDAQREACAAFITSQKQEGWRVLSTSYDDGGYSGGTLDRPALKQLLADVEAHKLDTIVVYKVDRLTRSLSDFAKIVEILDAHGVSFVSVTQQFNTTTSMGRLTLNILLSFAQFEREVTGERIRDKIAASKRKGMWMGGTVPLGYDRSQGRLVVNPAEAEQVRLIFNLYLELACVRKLRDRLIELKVRSKTHLSQTGRRFGGVCFSRGALYKLLNNPIYIGEVRHREQQYPGEHEAIIPRELWDKVQTQLRSTHQGRRAGVDAKSPSLLVGLLRDEHGRCFTPSHTLKNGKRYRYYFCQPQGNSNSNQETTGIRLPARDIEVVVLKTLQSFLDSPTEIMDRVGCGEDAPVVVQKLISAGTHLSKILLTLPPADQRSVLDRILKRIVVHPKSIELQVSRLALRQLLTNQREGPDTNSDIALGDTFCLTVPAEIRRHGLAVRLVVAPNSSTMPALRTSAPLLKALARSQDWSQRLLEGKADSSAHLAEQLGLSHRYVSRVVSCAFLAPDIVEAILDGRQPPDLTFHKLPRNLPLSWVEQRQQLGFCNRKQ
jgi:site-specific DNA recombinase